MRDKAHVRFGGWVVAIWLACAGTAWAQAERSPALSWVRAPGAESCISAPELARALEQHIGRPVLQRLTRADLIVEGLVSAASDGFVVDLRVLSASDEHEGRRSVRVQSSDCRSLDALLVFVLAVLIDPDAPLIAPELPEGLSDDTHAMLEQLVGAEPTEPDLALAQPAQGPPQGNAKAGRAAPRGADASLPRVDDDVSDAASSRAEGADEGSGWTLGLDAGGVAALGVLPGVGVGIAVGMAATHSRSFRLLVDASYYAPSAAEEPAAVSFSLVQAALGACPPSLFDAAAVRVWLCGGVQGGVLLVEPDAADARSQQRLALAAWLGPELAWSPGAGLALRLRLTALVPWIRERFRIALGAEQRRAAFQMAPVGGQIALALGFE